MRAQRLMLFGVLPSRVLANIGALGLTSATLGLSYFILSVGVARELGVAELGLFSVAVTISLFANRVAESGIHQIVVRELSRSPETSDRITAAGIHARLITAGAAFLVALVGLIVVAATAELIVVTLLLTAFVVLHGIARVFLAFTHAELRMGVETAVLMPSSVLIMAVGWLILGLGNGLVGLAWVYAAAGVLEVSVAWSLACRHLGNPLSAGGSFSPGSILRASWPIGMAGLAAFLYYRIDTLMLSRLVGDAVTGVYNMAFNLLYIPNLIFWALTGAAFPLLAAASTERDQSRLVGMYRRLVVAGLAVGLLVAFIYPVRGTVLSIAYGPVGGDASPVLTWLLLSQVFSFVAAAGGTTMNATGRQVGAMVVGLSGLVVNVGLNAVLIPKLGAVGAAQATLATEALVALVAVGMLWKTGLPLRGALAHAST